MFPPKSHVQGICLQALTHEWHIDRHAPTINLLIFQNYTELCLEALTLVYQQTCPHCQNSFKFPNDTSLLQLLHDLMSPITRNHPPSSGCLISFHLDFAPTSDNHLNKITNSTPFHNKGKFLFS